MAKIIVLGAMKGGVGKSVSTYNLAYSWTKLGKNVLVVDFDSSANITRCVVENIKTVEISIGDLMMNQMDEEEQPNPAEYIINRNGVDFIPSSKVLSAVDAKLRLKMGAEKILACILELLRANYDYILIDTCQYRFSLQKCKQSFRNIICCFPQNIRKYLILTCICPICLWSASLCNIINDRPWIVDFCITKQIAVIPFL